VGGALVTGVSGLDGIAAAVVRSLARNGWTVAGTGYRPYGETESWGSAPDAPEQLIAEGSLAAWGEDDLGDASAPTRVVAAAEQAVGPLRALVIVHTESRLGGVLDTTAWGGCRGNSTSAFARDSPRPCRLPARRRGARRVPMLARRRLAHRPDPRLRRSCKHRPAVRRGREPLS
jgi:NAD(P)-dependent dehydrogenase (short-subunit alcohol dehydrogenase family)